MERENQHYYSSDPKSKVKIYTVSESMRRHLYIFKTLPGVFSFKKIDLGTKVFINHMIIPKNPSVLIDLGCGYGPIGIVLGFESPQSIIYFIDVNKRAIWCVKENIILNLPYNRKQHIPLLGNYLNPIKTKGLKVDGVYMNPPLRQGRKEFLNIFDELPHCLKPDGFLQFVIKKKMGAEYIFKYLEDNFSESNIEILCKRSGYWVFNMVFN